MTDPATVKIITTAIKRLPTFGPLSRRPATKSTV